MDTETLFRKHPLPWTYVHAGGRGLKAAHGTDLGGIKDGNDEWVVWLGDDEQYYPTAGDADPDVLRALVSFINSADVHLP